MAVPRLCALAEVLWLGDSKPGWIDFKNRLRVHFSFLDQCKVHYANSIFDVTTVRNIVEGKVELTLESVYENGQIQYQMPDVDQAQLLLYKKGRPLVLKRSGKLRAQYYEGTKELGHLLEEEILVHKALGGNISSTIEPSTYYNEGGLPKLADSKAGHAPRLSSDWLGWSGKNPAITIDLGDASKLNNLDIYTLKEESNWIYLPQQISVSVSTDGINFVALKTLSAKEIEDGYGVDNKLSVSLANTKARYVKLALTCAPKIEKDKPGAGEDAWVFLSELAVN
jgi:hexosaminidase